MSKKISKKKLIKWMHNSMESLVGCIQYGKENDFDDMHSWGALNMQQIIIKLIIRGEFDGKE